jgi:hypothetical protein
MGPHPRSSTPIDRLGADVCLNVENKSPRTVQRRKVNVVVESAVDEPRKRWSRTSCWPRPARTCPVRHQLYLFLNNESGDTPILRDGWAALEFFPYTKLLLRARGSKPLNYLGAQALTQDHLKIGYPRVPYEAE